MAEIVGKLKGIDGGDTIAFITYTKDDVIVFGPKDLMNFMARMGSSVNEETGKDVYFKISCEAIEDDTEDSEA